MKRLKKISIITGIIIVILAIMIVFSPYKKYGSNQFRSVDVSVLIDLPPDSVYEYLGNSDNARDWSSFVDHITVLNTEEYKDGEVGSERRCFENKNEKGIYWDEEILEVIPNKKRRLSIYNMNGFAMTAEGLQTEQIYKQIGKNKSELTFTVFFEGHGPSWFESLKMYYSAYALRSIFEKNLDNIKRLTEKKYSS
jgi:uncharacterized protein YndB with AHSA1/START domain